MTRPVRGYNVETTRVPNVNEQDRSAVYKIFRHNLPNEFPSLTVYAKTGLDMI